VIRRALTLLAAAVLVTAVAAAPAAAGKVATVDIGTSFYAPAKKAIKQGDKVRFRWKPSFDLHDVNVKSGPEKFHSPLQAAGTWTRKFKKAGRYVLYCSQHTDMGMTLMVRKKRTG
jgi:plastocyanin